MKNNLAHTRKLLSEAHDENLAGNIPAAIARLTWAMEQLLNDYEETFSPPGSVEPNWKMIVGKWLRPSQFMPNHGQLILMKENREGSIFKGWFLDDDALPMTKQLSKWIEENYGSFDKYRKMVPRFSIRGCGSAPWENCEFWFGIPDPPPT